MKPNPVFEPWQDHPIARPTIAQIAGAFLCGGGIILFGYLIACVIFKLSK